MIETLRGLAWTPRPKPPLGIRPESRRKHWFKWYVVYQVKKLVYKIKKQRWERRTGGLQVWMD